MPDFITEPAFEIGRRAEIRGPYAWFAVLKPAEEAENALADFAAELSAVLDQPVRIVHGMAPSLERLRTDLHEPEDDPVVISDLDQADADHWRALDVNRSGFLRRGAVILWLSSFSLTGLCRYAPNLRSFVGGSIFYLGTHGEAMTPNEREQRISDLESHFHITSTEVIRQAELRALPAEPHFVEWLVLLGRGDLVWMPARAPERAVRLDGGLDQVLALVVLPSARDTIAQIRTYLLEQNAAIGNRNNVYGIFKKATSHDLTYITVGPTFDKGPTESHFYLESGSRLSFGITLRENNRGCSLVEYRFQLNLTATRSPSFYRFDLNAKAHDTPLFEPRCHIHPGADELRLPCPVLTPLEVLDRIFLVIEAHLS